MIMKLKLFKHLTLHQDIYTIFKILTIPTLKGMVGRIYPSELQLNKANASDTEIPFWIYIYLFQTDLFYPKFMISAMTDFDLVNLPFLDGDVFYLLRCLDSSIC